LGRGKCFEIWTSWILLWTGKIWHNGRHTKALLTELKPTYFQLSIMLPITNDDRAANEVFFCSQTPIWNLDSRNWSFCQKFFTPFKSWVNVYFCGLSIINRHLSMTIAKIVLKILEFLNSWIQFSLLLLGPQKLFRKQLILGHGEHYWGRMREP